MRAWCVVVPRELGEEVRQQLQERGLLMKHLRIVAAEGQVLLPTTERAAFGFPTKEHEFEEGFAAIRSYKDAVEVPDDLRHSLPSSFDVIGDIAVIKIPERLQAYRTAIGEAILRWNPRIRVVVQDRGVRGERRIRAIERIGGERRTTTVHVEHGLRYHVDLAQAYFSPRLASERKRIADLVLDGETVADPFAGVGPYAILIARRRRPTVVHASDTNPVAVDLLRANVAGNRADRVVVRQGDARAILREVAPVDRVVLDLPHSALDFVPDAFRAVGERGTVHVYRILERPDESEAAATIRAAAARSGRRIEALTVHRVRAYSPTQHHVAFDLTVARG